MNFFLLQILEIILLKKHCLSRNFSSVNLKNTQKMQILYVKISLPIRVLTQICSILRECKHKIRSMQGLYKDSGLWRSLAENPRAYCYVNV